MRLRRVLRRFVYDVDQFPFLQILSLKLATWSIVVVRSSSDGCLPVVPHRRAFCRCSSSLHFASMGASTFPTYNCAVGSLNEIVFDAFHLCITEGCRGGDCIAPCGGAIPGMGLQRFRTRQEEQRTLLVVSAWLCGRWKPRLVRKWQTTVAAQQQRFCDTCVIRGAGKG